MKSFADQAVIAIENTRLFEEVQTSKRDLQESLEYQLQPATCSTSSVARRSTCNACSIRLSSLRRACAMPTTPRSSRWMAMFCALPLSWANPLAGIGWGTHAGTRAWNSGWPRLIERRTIHLADVQAEADEYPEGRERALRSGWHTALSVPLVRGGEAIGAILIRRTEVRPFGDRQVELVRPSPTRPSSPSRTRGCSRRCRRAHAELTRSTRIADGHQRSTRRHQPLANAISAGAGRRCRECCAAVRCRMTFFLGMRGRLPVGSSHGPTEIDFDQICR